MQNEFFWCRKNNWCLIFSTYAESNFCWISIWYKLTKKQISNMYEMSFTQTRNPFIGELWPSFSSYFKYVAIVSFLFSFRLCLCPLVLVGSYLDQRTGNICHLLDSKLEKETLQKAHRILGIEHYNSFNTFSSQQKLLGQTSAWFCLAKG